jgi:hypothetical protein
MTIKKNTCIGYVLIDRWKHITFHEPKLIIIARSSNVHFIFPQVKPLG